MQTAVSKRYRFFFMRDNTAKIIVMTCFGLCFGPICYLLVSFATCPSEVLSPGGNFCDTCGMSCPFIGAWSAAAITLGVCLAGWTSWSIYRFRNNIGTLVPSLFWGATTITFVSIQLMMSSADSEQLGIELLENSKHGIYSAKDLAITNDGSGQKAAK